MPKRKISEEPTNTLKTHFLAAAPQSSIEAVSSDPHWLEGRRPPRGRLSQTLGGAIQIKCPNCRRTAQGPSKFVPHANPRDTHAYLTAMDALTSAISVKDGNAFETAREVIDRLKTTWCQICRDSAHRTANKIDTILGACRAEWQRLKTTKYNACIKCGCKHSIEANHRSYYAENTTKYKMLLDSEGEATAEKLYPRTERKLSSVSTVSFWSCTANGGIVGMREESEKCEALCSMCHRLDASSNTCNERKSDPEKARSDDYASNEAFYNAVYLARQRVEKREYVNSLKRAIGECQRLECPKDGPVTRCTEGYEQCFDCDHIREDTKGHEISRLVSNGNTFKKTKPAIDEEWKKCRLLCANCHVTRELWDPRSARISTCTM